MEGKHWQHTLNCGTYGDVIMLAVKHLGIEIRPKPDNAFAMQGASASEQNMGKKWIGSYSTEAEGKKKSAPVCLNWQIDRWERGAVFFLFDFADCHWICIFRFINECLLILILCAGDSKHDRKSCSCARKETAGGARVICFHVHIFKRRMEEISQIYALFWVKNFYFSVYKYCIHGIFHAS